MNTLPNYIITFLVLLTFLPVSVFSQSKTAKPGSIEYLVSANGFSDIILESDISSIPKDKLAFLDGNDKFDSDSCLRFAYREPNLLKLDHDLYLDLIGLRTYKNKVVNIYLFFKKADGYKVLRAFLTNYGLFTNKPNDYVDIYNWESVNVNLSLSYEIQADLGIAIFTCNPLAKEIEAMKMKKLLNQFNNK